MTSTPDWVRVETGWQYGWPTSEGVYYDYPQWRRWVAWWGPHRERLEPWVWDEAEARYGLIGPVFTDAWDAFFHWENWQRRWPEDTSVPNSLEV